MEGRGNWTHGLMGAKHAPAMELDPPPPRRLFCIHCSARKVAIKNLDTCSDWRTQCVSFFMVKPRTVNFFGHGCYMQNNLPWVGINSRYSCPETALLVNCTCFIFEAMIPNKTQRPTRVPSAWVALEKPRKQHRSPQALMKGESWPLALGSCQISLNFLQ